MGIDVDIIRRVVMPGRHLMLVNHRRRRAPSPATPGRSEVRPPRLGRRLVLLVVRARATAVVASSLVVAPGMASVPPESSSASRRVVLGLMAFVYDNSIWN
jgi:hypothetical protein